MTDSPDNSTSSAVESSKSSRQASHHAPDEPRARAIALRAQGYSWDDITQQVSIPRTTVQRWVRRAELAGETKPLLERHYRNGIQATELIADGLDAIEQDGDAKKHLVTLNVIAGTATDKIQKESAPPTQQNTQVIIVLGAEKPIIEGEVVESDAAGL